MRTGGADRRGASTWARLASPITEPRREITHVYAPRRHALTTPRPNLLMRGSCGDSAGGLPMAPLSQRTERPDAGFAGPGIRLQGRDERGRNWPRGNRP